MVWVLTSEYNDYNQYGEYYIHAWTSKPTADMLIKLGVHQCEVDHVLNGGGRRGDEEFWYHLNQEK